MFLLELSPSPGATIVPPRTGTEPWGHQCHSWGHWCPSQDWHRAVGPLVSLLGPPVSLLGPQMSLTGLAPSCGATGVTPEATGVPPRAGTELWGHRCPSQDSHCALGPLVPLLGPQMSLPGQAPSSGATSVTPGATGVPPRTVTKPEGHPCHSLGRRQCHLLSQWLVPLVPVSPTLHAPPNTMSSLQPSPPPCPLAFALWEWGVIWGGAVVAGRGPLSLCPCRVPAGAGGLSAG